MIFVSLDSLVSLRDLLFMQEGNSTRRTFTAFVDTDIVSRIVKLTEKWYEKCPGGRRGSSLLRLRAAVEEGNGAVVSFSLAAEQAARVLNFCATRGTNRQFAAMSAIAVGAIGTKKTLKVELADLLALPRNPSVSAVAALMLERGLSTVEEHYPILPGGGLDRKVEE